MTAPDRPVQDLIAEAVAAALPQSLQPVGAGLRNPPEMGGDLTLYGRRIVEAVVPAVVAACREATVEQQAQLVGATVEQRVAIRLRSDGRFGPVDLERLVTEWREDPS